MFNLCSKYQPCGDQPNAINSLVNEFKNNKSRFQTLIGATGTGKTFTAANIIQKLDRPALIISHNKTLAAQLYREFKDFFPDNSVEYFVSYYDYYQPEAYVAKKDLYIEKDSSINDEIDKLRLRATTALMERNDVIIISSVSCIYGLGSPEYYKEMNLYLEKGANISRNTIISKLIDIQYKRNDSVLERGSFRVRGDIIEIIPSYTNTCIRIELFGDEIERISNINALNLSIIQELDRSFIYPAKHFVMPHKMIMSAVNEIENELEKRIKYFEQNGKILEKERLASRTKYDLEMMQEMGYCSGIENYSRHLSARKEGEPPATLIDYFPKDFITFIDESHVTIPQIRGMYHGDRSRKESLVNHGFRLPSALDNRPLYFEEFMNKINKIIFISATPDEWEISISNNKVEQINRPTGLLDPMIEIHPEKNQIDDLRSEIETVINRNERVLITTLTKKMAEDLAKYLHEHNFKVKYLHSEIDTLERVEILKQLRTGDIDIIVGINLLREGLDLPEVSLVAILDADKIGFLRSKKSLLQTSGRAARNIRGKVIMYADTISLAMKECIEETNRRREIQKDYNKKHNIIPKTIIKSIQDLIIREKDEFDLPKLKENIKNKKELKKYIKHLEYLMTKAADVLDFEKAIEIREQIDQLKNKQIFK